MRKLTKLVTAFMMVAITLFSACTEKETPVPTENTERIDQLRQELRALQLQVQGEELELNEALLAQERYQDQIAALEAEIDRLEQVYARSVVYGVFVIDFQNNKLANASVKLAQDGEVFIATTDEDGYVQFENIRSGIVNAVVEVEGYTTANFTAALVEQGAYDEDSEIYKTSTVALFPAADNQDDTGMFTLEGTVYADLSAREEGYNALEGVNLRFFLELSNIKNNSEAFNNVRTLVYENAVYEATTAEDGSYEVKLPARSLFAASPLNKHFQFEVVADDFAGDYTYTFNGKALTEERVFRLEGEMVNAGNEAIIPGDIRTKNFYFSLSSKD